MKRTKSLYTAYQLYKHGLETYNYEDKTTILYGVEKLTTVGFLDDKLFERIPNLKKAM